MLAFAIHKVLVVQLAGLIRKRIDEVKSAPWSEGGHRSLEAKILEETNDMPNIVDLPSTRTVEFVYNGMPLSHNALDIGEEISWKVACAWKDMAVCQGMRKPVGRGPSGGIGGPAHQVSEHRAVRQCLVRADGTANRTHGALDRIFY